MITFQQLRPDSYTLGVKVQTPRDNYTHTIRYRSLDEAHANAEADIVELTRLAHLRAAIQDEMDKLPGLHEHTAHVDGTTKTIQVCMVSRHEEGTTHSEKYPYTQVNITSLDELPQVHEQHKAHVEAHKQRLADNSVKLARLKGLR